ncbi:MAG: alpha/beta hydrolase [Bacteroidetes bacterium]|nr:alpha/beta hydrolase [Bacteroidota bacterium]
MNNPMKYGSKPYNVAIIHGGPGAPGEMAPLAQELSGDFGIIEPLQIANTIEGQLQELHNILVKHGNPPVYLIGHSWGAWLVYIYAALYPALVKKIILISSGPFEEKDSRNIMQTRLNRLTNKEKSELSAIQKELSDPFAGNKSKLFKQFAELLSKADSFDPLTSESCIIEYQPDIFQSIWNEASKLRKSGKLIGFGKRIKCPVVAIHGDYDPHPAEGVKIPLSETLDKFKFILLKKCGHYPWNEKNAFNEFYKILRKEIK